MSDISCCFLQGDQGLPGEQGVPGDRGVGEAGPKVKMLHRLKLVNSDNRYIDVCTRSIRHKRLYNDYRENLEQLVLEASLVFLERTEHQGRRQI